MLTAPDLIITPDEDGQSIVVRRRTLTDIAEVCRWADAKGLYSASPGRWAVTQTDSMSEFVDMLLKGWPEGVQDASGLDGLATDRYERLEFVRDCSGAFPIVPAHLAGAPNSMLRPSFHTDASTRAVTLVINGSYSGNVGTHTAIEYAKRVMQLVAWLEAERIETAIELVRYAEFAPAGSYQVATFVTIRKAGDVMQPERIATCLHPSFLRRGLFAHDEYSVIERGDERMRRRVIDDCAYGLPRVPTTTLAQAALPEAHAVVLLPRVGTGDPLLAAEESINLLLRRD